MIINSVELENFGVFLGKQSVLLTPPSKNKPIILFGGKNGRGKTTFLDSLQLGLYGKLANCSNRNQLSYEEYLRRSIHHSVDPRHGANISIDFSRFSNGKEMRHKVSRSWSANGKGIKEYIEVYTNEAFDQHLTDQWLEFFEEFIPSKISNLFFFDGEKIEGYADLDNAAKLLSTAIKSLLGLDLISQLSKDLTILERRKQSKTLDSMDKNVISKLEEDIKLIHKQIEEKRGIEPRVNNKLSRARSELSILEDKFRQEGGEVFQKRHELEKNKQSIANEISIIENELLSIAKGPAPLLLIENLLEQIIIQDNKESRASNSKSMLEIIKARDQDILKQCAKLKLPKDSIENIKTFLSKDISLRISQAQVTPYLDLNKDSRSKLKDLKNKELPTVDRNINDNLKKYDALKDSLNVLDRKLAGVPSEESIATLIKQIKGRSQEIKGYELEISKAQGEINGLERQNELLESELIKKHELILEKQFENEDKTRFHKQVNNIKSILSSFHKEVLKRHIDRIQSLILDSFNQLAHKKTLIRDFVISSDDFSISIKGADGQRVSPDRLSAGERQLLSISMLWGLARASGRLLPSVIDTPLGRLDSEHRNNLVKNYFPYSSHQVFLLSTDEEIDKKHYDNLKPSIGHSYYLNFDSTKNATVIEKGYFW
jgi:DNA sulfur modification protein DndD